jgi:hypothetical protein
MNDSQMLDIIANALYSTKETQRNSYDLGRYVVENNIEGDIIECGVAMAGNFATMILGAISVEGGRNRKFWGFDSFEGIQLAGKKDTQQAGIGDIDDWALDGVRIACYEFFEEKGITPEIHTITNSTPTYFFKTK